MTEATNLYEDLLEDISTAIEVFQCLPQSTPDRGTMMWDHKPPREGPEGRLHSLQIVFPGKLYRLAMFIKDLSPVNLPPINSKPSMVDYVQSFITNKDAIMNLFDYVLSNPDKGYETDFKQIRTYESCLLSHAKAIKEMSKDIKEELEKLILCIDSEEPLQ